jgi:penicillin-binding protein 2
VRKKTKFLLLRTSIILLFAILAGRIWYVQVVMGSYYRQQADTSKIRLEPVQALRGIIYDRMGRPLVFNAPSWSVYIVPHGIPTRRAGQIYSQLANLLHGEPSAREIAGMVAAHQWQPYAPFVVKPKVTADVAMVIKQLHTQLPGVGADPSSIRQYVKDARFSLSHILGYTGEIDQASYGPDRRAYPAEHYGATDLIGRTGIESSVDAYLHGINGTDQVEVDAGERPVRVLRHGTTVPGDSIYLTIDWNLQQQVAQDLAAALNHLGLTQGVAILEDVHTGEILSMVSLPSYDDNLFSGGISTRHYQALLNTPGQPLNDLAVSGIFPPGSTYKVLTASAALQTHVADVNRYIPDTGSIRLCSVYDASSCRVYYGWNTGGLGAMNVVSALAESSDIYMYTVAGGNPNYGPMPIIGANRLAAYARLFGLGEATGIELPSEAKGLVPSQTWYDSIKPGSSPIRPSADYTWHIGDTYNMAIGQGYNDATPLQMVNVAATLANGGVRYHPRIIRRISGQVIPRRGALTRPQIIQPFVPSVAGQGFIDPANLRLIQQGMHESVTLGLPLGTSFAVTDKRIDAAGKTGTAEAGDKPPHAWWIGYAPFNHPKVAVCVMVPYAGGEGAYVAAPIAHKVLEDYFHLPPSKPNWLSEVTQTLVTSTGAQ